VVEIRKTGGEGIMVKKKSTPEDIINSFKKTFNKKIKEVRIEKRIVGLKKKEYVHIWMNIDRSVFVDGVKHLAEFDFPHLAVISGSDMGKTIELIYHFSIYYGGRLEELSFNFVVDLPKTKPVIPSLCDIIPGALVTEREIQEMLGVTVSGIPDNRRLFIPEDFPKGVYPWRKDAKGPQKMLRDLYEVKK
jgi:membrane-bound hydrogenase subunit beta